MIIDFACKHTEALYHSEKFQKRLALSAELQTKAIQKLRIIDAATTLGDLRVPPGNRLHALKGNRQGQHAIRINDQYRVCFRFDGGSAHEVEIIDYH